MDIDYQTSRLQVTPEIEGLLGSISKWARFLSIIIFVYLALSAISILFAGVMVTGVNAIERADPLYVPGIFSWGYATALLVALVIYFVPTYFLFKFSTNLQKALNEQDTLSLTTSFRFLQKNYKFIGILAIVMMVFFVIMFIVMLGGMMFAR